MKTFLSLKYLFALFAIFLLAESCKMQRETSVNRKLQNLTARYNILYNARLLLDQIQTDTEDSYYDDYSQVLPLYRDPAAQDGPASSKDLDSVIHKAYVIVNEKNQSNYVDDAYFIIAKANFLKGNFFDASEFFSYVVKNYPEERDQKLSSLAWKTRALLHLNNTEEASNTIDTALKYLDPAARTISEVYAAYSQFLINTGREANAIEPLKKALESGTSKRNRMRWTYILAQLQELNNQHSEAFANYGKVAKSNVSFEMAFNAELNMIRMTDEQGAHKSDRIAALRSMLKSDKNKDFADQIYYRIGDIYLERQQTKEAIESYIRTTRQQGSKNPVHKGLAYLKLADVYFRTGNYAKAKSYYDTTLATLPPNFPGYEQIKLKSSNLDLLADRFRVIAREDTLQTLARLSDTEREERIGQLVREQTQKAFEPVSPNNLPGTFTAAIDNPGSTQSEGKFYFNNSTAISQGFSDFRRRWGNRPSADNWRRSNKTAADITEDQDALSHPANRNQSTTALSQEQVRLDITKSLPLTPDAIKQSNERIAAAYYDIAGFYREDLKDQAEAIRTLENLLNRIPESTYTPAVYYNLYLLYSQNERQKSDDYKNKLLRQYPESAYAKVIVNPMYGKEATENEEVLNQRYNSVYNLYRQRKYTEVIEEVSKVENSYRQNKFSPQFTYLKALATGHTQKLVPFENSLKAITDTFSTDQIVTPLVRQHLLYIANNRSEISARPTALLDYDPENNIFMEPEPVTQPVIVRATPVTKNDQPVVTVKPREEPVSQKKDNVQTPGEQSATVPASPATEKGIPQTAKTGESRESAPFQLPETAEYYFVINVNSPGVDLSPSRFGIGQFNRSKFSALRIKHQLKAVNNENQLIFVGPFYSLAAVISYERSILPLIKDIMKVASERYNTFVVSKEELDKLNSRAMINSYVEFYKNYK